MSDSLAPIGTDRKPDPSESEQEHSRWEHDWRACVATYHWPLCRYFRRGVDSEEDVEDLIGETWTRVLEDAHAHSDPRHLLWARIAGAARAAGREFMKARRSHKLATELYSFAPPESRGAEYEDYHLELELWVTQALASLAPQQSRVLRLRRLEGLSTPFTATLMGLSQGTIKAHLHKAEARLQIIAGQKPPPRPPSSLE